MHVLLITNLLAADPAFTEPPLVPAVQTTEQVSAQPRRWHLWGLSAAGGGVGIATWVASAVNYFSTLHCSSGSLLEVNCRSGSEWAMVPFIGSYLALADHATASANNTGAITTLAIIQSLAIVMCAVGPFISFGGANVTATPAGVSGTF
jgi:hypothetical protein